MKSRAHRLWAMSTVSLTFYLYCMRLRHMIGILDDVVCECTHTEYHTGFPCPRETGTAWPFQRTECRHAARVGLLPSMLADFPAWKDGSQTFPKRIPNASEDTLVSVKCLKHNIFSQTAIAKRISSTINWH